MTYPRRAFLRLAGSAIALPALLCNAQAQTYPAKPVRIVVGFVSGSATDIITRLMGQWLSERLGQPFIVENRGGAGGSIATETVVRAPADGYTLLACGSWDATNTSLYDKLSYNFSRDITPIASIGRGPNVLVVHPSFPARTVPEFIAYAKANPGKINFASGGNGTPPHVSGELFKMMTGVNLVHVPYRGGGPALTDLLGGQVQTMFVAISASIEYVRAGNLRPLAVTTASRSDALPDIPTVGDFIPGYEASTWCGIGAPKGTPAEVIDKLNKEINAGLVDPKMQARLANMGSTALPGSPADFGKLIAEETEKWAKVVKLSGAKPD